MSSPYDITRCLGRLEPAYGDHGDTLHPECIGCQRRQPGDPERQSYMMAPHFEKNCPMKIIGEVK